jgi:Protein of unknown function (DUF3179)
MTFVRPLPSALAMSGLVFAGLCIAQQKPAAKDLPYVTVDHPEFIPAAKATFMSDSDRLIGVMDGRLAKAYAAAILSQHGVVQDLLKTGPIAVTW